MNSFAANKCHQDIESHIHWLRSIIRARIRCSQTADDLTGEVVTDALRKKEDWFEIKAPGPWLYRVAIRKVFLEKRRRRRQEKREAIAAEDRTAWIHHYRKMEQPVEMLMEQEKAEQVRAALDLISGKDAEILLLKYAHGWSYQKISENLGLELKKVAGRLRTARSHLKWALIELGVGEE